EAGSATPRPAISVKMTPPTAMAPNERVAPRKRTERKPKRSRNRAKATLFHVEIDFTAGNMAVHRQHLPAELIRPGGKLQDSCTQLGGRGRVHVDFQLRRQVIGAFERKR